MKRKLSKASSEHDLFRQRLDNMIDLRHELCRLVMLIDWEDIDQTLGGYYCETGRPAIATRLMVGLLYLQHTFDCSDEAVVARWVENPYWQYFCGEDYFCHELPIHPTSLTKFRQRIGESGCEELLAVTVDAGLKGKVLKKADCRAVVVDTTVMEKAVAYPTDSKLLYKAREELVKLAQGEGISLRQNYRRKAKRALVKSGRYGHAKQYKRMRKEIKHLRNWLGRVIRDIGRKTEGQQSQKLTSALLKAKQLYQQQTKSKNKLYSWHAPEVGCISKGKARQRYEFGVKVSVVMPAKVPFVLSCRSLPGNPYDGHTLVESLVDSHLNSGIRPKDAYVDKGYRGHQAETAKVYLAGQKQGVTKAIKKQLKRRNAIEPVIGHMKADGKLKRNWLKGQQGDAINAILCGAGFNLRVILKKLRLLFAWIFYRLLALPKPISINQLMPV